MNQNETISLCCLFGGKSSEYEVSLSSVYSVLSNMNRERYDLTLLGVTREGVFYVFEGDIEDIKNGSWCDESHRDVLFPAAFLPDGKGSLLILRESGAQTRHIQVAFPVMHGGNCEDGRLQGLLDIAGIPYVGPGCTASAVSMDKDFTKKILLCDHVPMAKWVTLTREEIAADLQGAAEKAQTAGAFPLFVKPANAGSSVGVSKAKTAQQLEAALQTAAKEDGKVLVEEFIPGREVECAVFCAGGQYFVADPGEVEPGAEFYDYHDKYIGTASRVHLPARIEKETAAEVKRLAEQIFKALGCDGLSRVDFFVSTDGEGKERVIFNEINTLPGFTPISMYPKMMIASGYTYAGLVDALVQGALAK